MQPSDGAKAVVVLVADDELLVRMAATDILQEAGYHVVEAHDGVEALAVLEIRDDVAAMLTDIAMPNMNGVELAKIVSERWPDIGIVITTGAVPRDVELEEVPPQARVLSKPYSAQRLVQAIEAVLPLVGGPVTLKSLPTIPAGREFGAGGLAQPLPEPEE